MGPPAWVHLSHLTPNQHTDSITSSPHKTQKYLIFLNLLALCVGTLATDCSAF